ncbi:MAG: aspartate dehydrogenase [Cytophagales bacterium]|nr:aspartate dehydrogenase [Cytophagales bacterium]
MKSTLHITLIGYGAIAKALCVRLANHSQLRITHVVVRAEKVGSTQSQLPVGCLAVSHIPQGAALVVECAGHSALREHVLPALARGVPCAIMSIGALSQAGLIEALSHAASQGGTQLHLLSGAIGAMDALASAKLAGLTSVTYTGRKPPLGWKGTPAESVCDLASLTEPTILLQATAREASRLYPKNANVAATVSLAGLGLDHTQVTLIADPSIADNIHEVEASGAFGSFTLKMRGKPLADNPKTSLLTVLSALRFLENQVNPITI